ncbi:MAG: isoprenylcysteine carboxylmethyltransferase family protein [Selenomonas sp.]|nr:isoprenylcysteine carboxylmethyltransferase family protein [Selenomonas sp.]
MKGAWLKAILLLPFNVTVIIPALLLWYTGYQWCMPAGAQLVLGIIFFCGGFCLFIKTTLLFHNVGKGTLSPWAPPERLVIQGPYKRVRNPMILGILFILLSEALLFSSCCIFIYALIFFVINCVYFKTVEEKRLLERFGQDYRAYRDSVPMWLPDFRGKRQGK